MITVIAVDDEQDAKVLFQHFFKKEISDGTISLNYAQTGEECLRLLGEYSERACVLTDINMPSMDGLELTKIINLEYPEVKVFLVSAYDAGSQLQQIQNLRIAEYINKPVDFGKLKEKIFYHFGE